MSDSGATQPGTRIDEDVWEEFRNDVEERFGTVRGHLRHELENAIREYIHASNGGDTHDRLRRIEREVESISKTVDGLQSSNGGKKKKESDVSQTTKNRLDEIQSVIEKESGKGPVHEAVVRHAIEDVAGHSDPTIRRYRQMLVDRNIVYPHPKSESKYVYGDEHFVTMIQSLTENGAMSNDRYWEYVDEFGGEDAWQTVLEEADNGSNDRRRDEGRIGFQ